MLDIIDPTYSHKHLHYLRCDLSNIENTQEAFNSIYTEISFFDYAFLNAGVYYVGSIEDTSMEVFEKIVNLNLRGIYVCLQQILPKMRENEKGSIVLMGSDQSFIGKSRASVYGLTKAAIGQLTKSTAIDYAAYGVRVNCVCPGTVNTPLYENAVESFSQKTNTPKKEIYNQLEQAQPLQRIGRPEEIASAVLFLCSDKASFITGSLLPVDGGYTAQ